jgi:hypothetical protein
LTGLLAFLALEGAVFIRYTNVGELIVAGLGVFIFRRFFAITWRQLIIWGSSVAAFGVVDLCFNQWAYGHATSTGYSAGEITFATSAFWPNLKGMPKPLTTSMPLWLLALTAVIAIGVRFARIKKTDEARRDGASTDARIALILLGAWLAIWGLYLNYTWTVGGAGGTVHVIRFYLPAIGALSLLSAWLLTKINRAAGFVIVAGLAIAAFGSFNAMASNGSVIGGQGGPGMHFPGGQGGPQGSSSKNQQPGGPFGGQGGPQFSGSQGGQPGNFGGGTPPKNGQFPSGGPGKQNGTFPNGGKPPKHGQAPSGAPVKQGATKPAQPAAKPAKKSK